MAVWSRMASQKVFAALLLVALAGGEPVLGAETCAYAPPPPTSLQSRDKAADYSSVLRVCESLRGARAVATRTLRLGGTPYLLLADPQALTTRIELAACWRCSAASEGDLEETRLMRSVALSADAPGLAHRGFLENAGLVHSARAGEIVTGDLCPSQRPLDRGFFETLESVAPGAPVALAVSGVWLTHHFEDFSWLLAQKLAGKLDIVWANHSYRHRYARGVADAQTYLMTPGTDIDEEILDTERLLIANGQAPSLFFRFPGLASNAPLMRAVRRHHLIALGADAWLAIGQKPGPGSIILVHPNGNEETGLRVFARDLAQGAIRPPFDPLAEAPP